MESSNNIPDEHHLSGHDHDILDTIFNPSLPYADVVDDVENNIADGDGESETESDVEAKLMEVEGVKAAESGDVMSAIDYFNKSITINPARPSGYNNRAQALRLINDKSGAMDDLSKAIELSDGNAKVACQAFTQRALINKLDGKDDEALEDFQKAADLGGAFAKQMVISLNPYAALCNQMMAEMITKMKRGELEC